MVKNVYWSRVKFPNVILCRFQRNLTFLDIYSKSTPNTKFQENMSSKSPVVPCGQNDGRTDGHIDITKLIVAFLNSAKATERGLKPFYVSSCVSGGTVILILCHICVCYCFCSIRTIIHFCLCYSFYSLFSSDVIYHIPPTHFHVLPVLNG